MLGLSRGRENAPTLGLPTPIVVARQKRAAFAALFSVSACDLLFSDGTAIVLTLVPFREGHHFHLWEHVVADGD